MLINVTVESIFAGPSNGNETISIDDEDGVQSIIDKYCQLKNIEVKSEYVLHQEKNTVLDNFQTVSDAGLVEGDVLYLMTEGDTNNVFNFGGWLTLSIIALVMGVGGMVVVSIQYTRNGQIPFDYGIVFDAGSTHTSVVLYLWEGSKWYGTGIVKEVSYCYIKGGITDLAADPDKVDLYLDVCMKQAVSLVPRDRRSASPIFLGATAGMRLLNLSDSFASRALLHIVRDKLSVSTFLYDPSEVRIISGQEEGASGWITVNYLQHTFPAV